MPVEDIISEALLLRLRQTPKRVTHWPVRDRKKSKHIEWMCESKAEDGDDFQIYMATKSDSSGRLRLRNKVEITRG